MIVNIATIVSVNGFVEIMLHLREHWGNIRGTFREGTIQGPFREHSGHIQGTFREHSGIIWGAFREHSG
jgi:hypothetical protein